MPVFDKPITARQLIEQQSKHDPDALILIDVIHYGPDAIAGVFGGYVSPNEMHSNMPWVYDPADGYVLAVKLMRIKPTGRY